MKKSSDIEIQDEFRTKKVMTMHELCQLIKKTPRTVQRRLKSWGAISSYNKNGRYYVLPDIAKFDKYGIWRYQNCYFSKNITLKKTFIYLVEISDAGLTGQELGKILGLDQRSFLSHFRDSEQVHREKFNDRYIYFSSKKSKYEQQKRRRQRLELRLDLPTDAEAVMILVEYIKYPKIKVEEISERLKQIGIEISFKKIDNLFEYHNIKKKLKSVRNLLSKYLDTMLVGLNVESPKVSENIMEIIKDAAAHLKGSRRRIFMAKTVNAFGKGGQRKLERVLNWSRKTIRKGQFELENGLVLVDNFSKRGRKKSEELIPRLLEDIKSIALPTSQADPTFRTTKLYTPLTAKAAYDSLINEKGYTIEQLPTIRTIRTKLNDLNFHPQRVAKSKPKKKIPETDEIFKVLHIINKIADNSLYTLRLSMDAKARINIGSSSRGGKNRRGESGADHDFAPDEILIPWGIFLPVHNETFFYFTKSKVTPDFMIDALQDLWPMLKQRFNPNTLVINMDNGPENNSYRTQFIKRIVMFSHINNVNIILAYYPPYHSKYNPIERVWGVLENHWNGEILDSIEKTLGLAKTMTWNGIEPVVKMLDGEYKTGITVPKKEMEIYNSVIDRYSGLEKYFVEIDSSRTSVLG